MPPVKQAPAALQRLPVRVATLPSSTAVPVSALYLALAVWTLAQVSVPGTCSTCFTGGWHDMGHPTGSNQGLGMQGFSDPMRGVAYNDAPGLQLAIALGAAVYVLSDKKRVPRGNTAPWGHLESLQKFVNGHEVSRAEA